MEAPRRAEAGNDAYRQSSVEAAVEHNTPGALLDPRDIAFLTNRAAAYFRIGKYEECVRDCDEAVERGRELSSGSELIATALFQKALALLELACCAADYTPAIRALKLSLAEDYSEETLDKLNEAESVRRRRLRNRSAWIRRQPTNTARKAMNFSGRRNTMKQQYTTHELRK